MRCLLVLLLLLPVAQGVAWEDPEGDHEMSLQPEAWAPAPEDWYPMGDVRRIEMTEVDASKVRFSVELAGLEPGEETVEHDGVEVGLRIVGHPSNGTFVLSEEHDGYWMWFVREVVVDNGAGEQRIPRRDIGGPADIDGNVLSATFSKGAFTADGWGPAVFVDPGPRAGETVQLVPTAERLVGFDTLNRMDLRDPVGEAKDFTFEVEPPRRGDLEMYVEKPVRASNGAATTYLYDVSARNEGDEDHTARVTVSAPGDWVVRAPFEVEVPAGQTILFPVAVSVPFGHQHGTHETATVKTVADDGSEATADIHVYWHDPPVPGGHHPRVALKVAFGYPHFDTNPAPDAGTAWPWETSAEGTSPIRDVTETFRFGLAPGRSVGLDFDSEGQVTGQAAFEIHEASDIRLTGRLILTGGPTIIAQQVHEASWEAGVHHVEWQMPIEEGIDQFPPDEGGNLAFEFILERQVTDPSVGTYGSAYPDAQVHLVDNWFDLPLADYHEQIDLSAIGVARLSVHTPEEARLVNPEEVAVIPFEVANHASAQRRLDWSLDTTADWVSMQAPPERLDPGQNASFSVIAAPGALPDGEIAQVLVVARDLETGIESFGRVAVTVTTGQDVPDQRRLAPDEEPDGKDAPLPVVLLLAALAVAAWRRPS